MLKCIQAIESSKYKRCNCIFWGFSKRNIVKEGDAHGQEGESVNYIANNIADGNHAYRLRRYYKFEREDPICGL